MEFDDWIECTKIIDDPNTFHDTYCLNDGRSIEGNHLTEQQRERFRKDADGEGNSPSSPVAQSCAERNSRKAPTSEEINELPNHIRNWIHALETRCDRQGDLRRLRAAEQKAEQAEAALAELEDEIRSYISDLQKRASRHFDHYQNGEQSSANFADAFSEAATDLQQIIGEA